MDFAHGEEHEKNSSDKNVRNTRKRHLVFLCEVDPRQDYTVRKWTPGCDRFVPHSTTKTNETDTDSQPWFSVCPHCGKKARMANRTADEFGTRQEAVAEAYRRTLKRQKAAQEGA